MVSQTGTSPRGRGFQTPEFRRERRPSQDGSEYAVVRDTERRELTLQHLLQSQNANEFHQGGERYVRQDVERYDLGPESRLSQDGSELAAVAARSETVNTSRLVRASDKCLS
jgi:hypothetical protein